MYCNYCGQYLDDQAAVCVRCGRAVTKVKHEGKVSCGWWWLGFFVPMAGLLIFLFLRDTEPVKAKKAGWGALIGMIVSVASVILLYMGIIFLSFLPIFFLV